MSAAASATPEKTTMAVAPLPADGDVDGPSLKDRIVRAIHRHGMLREGEPESVMAQKIMMLVFAVLSIPIAGVAAYYWGQVPSTMQAGAPYAGLIVASIVITAFSLTFALGYLILRLRGGKLTTVHTVIYWLVLEAEWTTLVLSDPNFPAPVGSIAMVICHLVTTPPLLPLHFISPISIVTFDIINQSFGTTIYLPEARFGPPGEHLVALLIVWCALLLALLTIYAKTVSSAAQAKRSRISADMTNEVVALLQSYDTERVKSRLSEYKSISDVDLKLLEAFNSINDNLERYRPHLPNYILMPETDDEGSVHSESLTVEDVKGLQDSPGSAGLIREERSGDRYSHGSGRSRESGSFKTEGTSTHTAQSVELQHSPPKPPAAAGVLHQHQRTVDRLFIGRVTLAQVDFIRLPLEGRSNWLPPLIDAVYESAATYQGSIHSLLGDTLTVSWNATRRVAQSELKATRFLYKVQRAMAEKGLAVCGAAMTGSASCESVQSSTGQQAFLVHCGWRDALNALASLAARFHSILIDEATNTVAHYDFDTRAVDQLSYVNPAHGKSIEPAPRFLVSGWVLFRDDRRTSSLQQRLLSSSRLSGGDAISPCHGELPVSGPSEVGGTNLLVYELVAEFKRADDEWMYQLEEEHGVSGSKKSSSAEITQAMTRIVRGEFGEAAATLQLIFSRMDSKRSLLRQDGIPNSGCGGPGFPHRMLEYCEQRLLQ